MAEEIAGQLDIEALKKTMKDPQYFADLWDEEYRTVMRWAEQGLIQGPNQEKVVRIPYSNGRYNITLIPANAIKPEKRKPGPKRREKKPLTPIEVQRIMSSINDQLSDDSKSKLQAVSAEQAYKLAQTAYPKQFGSEQATWVVKLDYEHQALTAALDYFHVTDGLRELEMALYLSPFWNIRGHWTEGRAFLQRAISSQPIGHTSLKTRAMGWLAYMTYRQGEYESATELGSEALAMARTISDAEGIALAQHCLGFVAEAQGRYEDAIKLFADCIDAAVAADKTWLIIWALRGQGFVYEAEGNYADAKRCVRESLKKAEEIGNTRGIAGGCENLGAIALREGHYNQARQLLDKSLALNLGMGNKNGIANCYFNLGLVEEASGDYQAGCQYFQRSLTCHQETGDKFWFALGLEAIGRMAHHLGDGPAAARFFGAANSLRLVISTPLSPADQKSHGQIIADAKAHFPAQWRKGSKLAIDQAVSSALTYSPTVA